MLYRTKHHRIFLRSQGFTLVEMLVAVTLVLVMMVLFAEVFQIAGGAISKTRGIAENDQRARTLQTIIKADLDKRTMRWVYPFAADEVASAPESNIGKRQGYIYISENNPFNALDDVLQFTVMATLNMRNRDNSPYYGQAMNLPRGGGSVPNFGYNNQPDADDADLNPNNTGLSTIAEIAYFVRNGNLYRRQLLIREPISVVGNKPQPADNDYRNIFNPSAVPIAEAVYPSSFGNATTFWADFDYSAVFTGSSTGARFLSSDALNNGGTVAAGAIAAPYNRFGFSPFSLGSGLMGRPKEFISVDSNTAPVPSDDLSTFIGRYTMQETSDPNFRYPQSTTSNGNIPTHPRLALALDPVDKTVISPDDFGQGIRRGEDLMLANVHGFDIQIWDDGIQEFVNVGDSTLSGNADYDRASCLNTDYGPRLPGSQSTPTIVNAVYDTWHPKIDIDSPPGSDLPPYRPLLQLPSATVWLSSSSYAVGDLVFPTSPPPGVPFAYRCIRAGTSGTIEPTWTRADGLSLIDGPITTGPTWQAVDRRKPLTAIRITIRFFDTSSQQLRQVSIVHSLVD